MSQAIARRFALVASVGLFLGPLASAGAANIYLTNSGDWNVNSNWSLNRTPNSSDDIYVADAIGADFTVAVPTGVTALGRFVKIGNIGTGAATISGGTLIATRTTLGALAGSSGTVTMTGGTWQNNMSHSLGLVIGDAGTGEIKLSGGSVSADQASLGLLAGSVGIVTISGTGTMTINNEVFTVGSAGSGTVTVKDGGKLNTALGTLATESTASGTVTVTGTGSAWSFGNSLSVGYQGIAQLNVLSGGRVFSPSGTVDIGSLSGSNGTAVVDGTGSTLEAQNVNVGSAGTGALNIKAGGTVTSTIAMTVGTKAPGAGTVLVEGAGASLAASNLLSVGELGTGTLTIQDGGTVNAPDVLVFGAKAGSTGTLNLNAGGTLQTHTLNKGDGNYQLNFNGGTLQILGTNFVSAMKATLGNGTVTTIDTNGQAATLSGAISGSGGLLKKGAGTLVLGGNLGDTNTYSGGTTISEGTVRVDSSTALGATSGALAIASGGILELNGQSVTVGSLSGAGTVQNATGSSMFTSVLTIDAAANSSFSGTMIDGGGAGKAALVKKGAATVTFTGANSFTGGTTVSAGTLAIDGSAASLAGGALGNLTIGAVASQTGTLRVSNGATVTGSDFNVGEVAGSTGAVQISGAGTTASTKFLEVGDSGTGSLDVLTGATLATTTNAAIGTNSGSNGTVAVSGSGSKWTVENSLNVGYGGTGTLNISSAGAVSVTSSTMNIGHSGTGTLNISSGGTLASNATLGTNAGSLGTVVVDGAGSVWTAASISLGYLGSGQLDIQNGGLVIASDSLVLANRTGSVGTINLKAGGTLRTSGIYGNNTDLVGTSVINFSGGTLQVYGGELQSSVNATLATGTQGAIDTAGFAASTNGVFSGGGGLIKTGAGVLNLSGKNTYLGATSVQVGTLLINGDQSAATGTVTVAAGATLGGAGRTGGAVTVSGTLAPGNISAGASVPGVLTVTSLSLTSTARIEMQINGTALASFDRISTTAAGTLSLNGVLALNFGTTLTLNQSINLFTGMATISGNFSSVAIGGTAYGSGNFVFANGVWTSQQGNVTLVFNPATGVLSAVPEPSVYLLLALGLAMVAWPRIRKASARG